MDVLIYAPQKYFNFAAIVRTLDFFGLHKVYLVDSNDLMQPFEECSKSWKRKLKNVSSGSIKHVKVEKVDDSFIFEYKGRSIATFAETAKARQNRLEEGANDFNKKLIDLDHFQFKQDDLLIFGSESVGVPKEILEVADCCLSLPTRGAVDSLNLGVCVGVFIREAVVQGAFAREHSIPRVFSRRGSQDSSESGDENKTQVPL